MPRRWSRITSAPATRASSPSILQPAEPFLDLSGEDIRRRMFLTTDPDGNELCLRPGSHHSGLARLSRVARRPARPPASAISARCSAIAARRRPNSCRPASNRSAARDTAAADAEMLALGLEATAHYGIADAGNPHGRCRAVRRADRRARSGAGLEAPPGEGLQPHRQPRARSRSAHQRRPRIERPDYQGVLAAMAGSDPKAAHALVTDLLSIAGITAVGGRSVGEIADRFLEQAALGASSGLPRATRALIEQFLAISRRSGRGRRRAAHSSPREARARSCRRARPVREPHRLSRRAGRGSRRASASPPRSAAASITTPASCSSCTTRTSASSASSSPADAMTGC